MKRNVIAAAAMAAVAPLVDAQGSQPVIHKTLTSVVVVDLWPAVSTSTAYATSLVTILGCPPWETACPVRHNSVAVVTLNTAVSTTVCPLTLTSSRLSSYDTEVVSTQAPTPPFLPTISRTTTTRASGSEPSQDSSFSIPEDVWTSQSDISLGEPTGPFAGSKGDPAPTSLGSDFLNPPDASVDSSALSSLSSALSEASSTAANASPTGPVAGSSASPAPSATISPAPTSSVSSAASNSVISVLGGGSVTLDEGSSASASSAASGNVISVLGGGSITLDGGSSATSGVAVASSAASDSASGSSGSSASDGTVTSGLLSAVTDGFGNILSTSVSAHTDITTISGPSGVTVSISTGSVTILVGQNTTSVIQHFLPYTYSAAQSTVTFPNVTYMPTATGNITSNISMSTSTPLFSNDGTSAPVNMFSICLAIVALLLVL